MGDGIQAVINVSNAGSNVCVFKLKSFMTEHPTVLVMFSCRFVDLSVKITMVGEPCPSLITFNGVHRNLFS